MAPATTPSTMHDVLQTDFTRLQDRAAQVPEEVRLLNFGILYTLAYRHGRTE